MARLARGNLVRGTGEIAAHEPGEQNSGKQFTDHCFQICSASHERIDRNDVTVSSRRQRSEGKIDKAAEIASEGGLHRERVPVKKIGDPVEQSEHHGDVQVHGNSALNAVVRAFFVAEDRAEKNSAERREKDYARAEVEREHHRGWLDP